MYPEEFATWGRLTKGATKYVKEFTVCSQTPAGADERVFLRRYGDRFVTIKSAEHQSLQSVHRMRERLIQERTVKSNRIRSMFAEEGVIFPIGLPQLGKGPVALVNELDGHSTPLLRRLGSMYLEQLKVLLQWLDELISEVAEIFKSNEVCQRLATVHGIGPDIATALVSSVRDPSSFKYGRQFAAWLRLTPMQRSSGAKTKLGSITKRGGTYRQPLLVQGEIRVVPADGGLVQAEKTGNDICVDAFVVESIGRTQEAAMHKEQDNEIGEKERLTVNEVVNKVTNDKVHEVKGKGQKHAGRIEKRHGGAKGAIRKND